MAGHDRNSQEGAPFSELLPLQSRVVDAPSIERAPSHLIDSPLDFIFAEHQRQRTVSALISMAADGECGASIVEAVVRFLRVDYQLHIADEELSLFPMLKVRCLPEDGMDAAIAKIVDEHRREEAETERVVEDLRAIRAGAAVDGAMRARLNRFAEQMKQHLAFENGILLPIARVRLNPLDLAELADSLRRRRVQS